MLKHYCVHMISFVELQLHLTLMDPILLRTFQPSFPQHDFTCLRVFFFSPKIILNHDFMIVAHMRIQTMFICTLVENCDIHASIRIKTDASKSKEGNASQTSVETIDNVTLSKPTTTAATTTTPVVTTVPTPQTNKLPPTTPKKRKTNTTGKDPNAGGNSPTALKKKEISKSAAPTAISLLRIHRTF
ncbi:unnamed protein product [Vicia faba]|uniref:Uncharacterized protein n=1 Tax=Vicia faba TaxID=3906 RepID=A0AAV0YUL1_VICFA|nr:unnamed protein product [Vicia faba]